MSRAPLAVLAAALLCSGCGSVGEPLPPLLNIPAKVTDLRVAQLGGDAELRWTWPLLTTEGSTLRDLERFEVVALDIPEGGGPPPIEAFEQLGKTIAVVAGDALPTAGPGAAVEARASLADRFGKSTAFAVRGVSSREKASPWSDFVIREVLHPADAPPQPRAESTAAGVELSWPAVDRASRYVVERRTGDGAGFTVLGSTDSDRYVDETAPLEIPLAYRVRSQVGEPSVAVDSKPSPEIAITRPDVFPPAVPAGLRAVGTADAVELTWSSVRDADLAGYEVLRNGEPAHEGLLTTPAFRDSAPRRDGPNEYRVRAVDGRGNRSEPSEPAVASLP